MRFLFLGAGATGGYYGGRMAASGADVSFLVRPARAEKLARNGLSIESPRGNVQTAVKVVTAADVRDDYDVVVLSCKAYDLDSAIAAIRPAVGPNTRVLPLLNGMRHLDALDAAFGPERVLGGTCHISVTLAPDGGIKHFSAYDVLTQGPRTSGQRDLCLSIKRELKRAAIQTKLSDNVVRAMWEKWVLLASLAGLTTLMRANVGEIMHAAGGKQLMFDLIEECRRVAISAGYPPRVISLFITRTALTNRSSQLAASMLRDLQAGRQIEADHIIGDLIDRAAKLGVPAPLLTVTYTALSAYQNRLQEAAKPA